MTNHSQQIVNKAWSFAHVLRDDGLSYMACESTFGTAEAEVERRLSVADEVEGQIDTNLKRAARLRQAVLKRAFGGDF